MGTCINGVWQIEHIKCHVLNKPRKVVNFEEVINSIGVNLAKIKVPKPVYNWYESLDLSCSGSVQLVKNKEEFGLLVIKHLEYPVSDVEADNYSIPLHKRVEKIISGILDIPLLQEFQLYFIRNSHCEGIALYIPYPTSKTLISEAVISFCGNINGLAQENNVRYCPYKSYYVYREYFEKNKAATFIY